jgi:putative ubiquitin-RnfH superfamily antitoxin RatB of RatAB toxin-antitoxin module
MVKINIEVAYASEHKQFIIPLEVDQPCTVEDTIQLSGLLSHCPEIDLQKIKVGIFSKTVQLSQIIKHGDRIEVYRPITIDPKLARINRVKKTIKINR